jgi:membrane protein implicated in regulation of membrane protease activity
MAAPPTPRRTVRAVLLAMLLLAPFVGLLYPPLYARVAPRLSGIPFFIWYQFAWLIGVTVLLVVVYLLRGEDREP